MLYEPVRVHVQDEAFVEDIERLKGWPTANDAEWEPLRRMVTVGDVEGVGGDTTVTGAEQIALWPFEPYAVNRYVVVMDGVTYTVPVAPETLPTPEEMDEDAVLVVIHDNALLLPLCTDVGEATRLQVGAEAETPLPVRVCETPAAGSPWMP